MGADGVMSLMPPRRFRVILRAFLLAVFSVLFIFIVGVSGWLRPIADDYCLGSSASMGLFAGLANHLGWADSILTASVQFLSAGIPLVFTPAFLSSSFPFVMSGVSVGILTTVVMGELLGPSKFARLSMTLILAVGWWLHLRVAGLMLVPSGEDSVGVRPAVMAQIFTHWQTINGGLISFALVLTIFIIIYRNPQAEMGRKLGVSLFLGVLLGVSGFIFSLTFLVVFTALAVVGLLVQNGSRWREDLAIASGILVGFAAVFALPGSRARVETNGNLDLETLGIAIRNLPAGLVDWFDMVFSYSTLFAVALGFLLQLAFGSYRKTAPIKHPQVATPVVLGLASLVFWMVQQIAETVVYNGVWHFSFAYLLAYVAAAALGAHLGRAAIFFQRPSPELAATGVAGVLTLVLLVSSFAGIAAGTYQANVFERYARWEAGPAAVRELPFAPDREFEWVNACYVSWVSDR